MDIGEIARRAGVSRSTVSYVLSGKRAVSESTRRRIEKVITNIGSLEFRIVANRIDHREDIERALAMPLTSRELKDADGEVQYRWVEIEHKQKTVDSFVSGQESHKYATRQNAKGNWECLMKIDPFPWAAPLEDVKLKKQ